MKKYLLALTCAIFYLITFSQEEVQPNSSLPIDHIVRTQVDGMMMQELQMITDSYASDVVLIKFPDVELANGFSAAKKYWTSVFSKKEEKNYEIQDFYLVGNLIACKVKQTDPVTNTDKTINLLIELKDSKISRVYYIGL
jgi:hypothetical protein